MSRRQAAKQVKLKRGKLSQEEESYIDRYHERHTAEQMAARLRRPVSTIQKYLNTLSLPEGSSKRDMKLADELKTRPEWDEFRQQFTPSELDFFAYRYVQLMGQFRDDHIVHTDEMQIFQVISIDILMQRTMKEKLHAMQQMERYEAEMRTATEAAALDAEARLRVKELEQKYAKAAETQKHLSARWEGYHMRHSAMLKELKATRDQRVRILENSKMSFLGMLRLLNDDEGKLFEAGREAELQRLAAQKEKERLTQPHKFPDGMTDQPLLTPETVREYDPE